MQPDRSLYLWAVEMEHRVSKFWKLRIAFSAVCGIVCLLLFALWERSYSHGDYLYWNFYRYHSILLGSTDGRVMGYSDLFTIGPSKKTFRVIDRDAFLFAFGPPHRTTAPLETKSRSPVIYGYHTFGVSHWFLVATTAAIAVAPWLKRSWQFSLRTLLIATTLVAVLLGAVVYAMR